MKVVLAHDHIIYEIDGSYYSNGSFSYDILSRYLEVFDEISFLSRQQEYFEENTNLTLASGINTEFIKVPNFRSIKTIKNNLIAKKVIKEEIKKSEYVIARLPSSIGKLAISYAIKYKKPYLVEVVGCAWDAHFNYGSLLGKFVAPFEYVTNKSKIKNASYVIYITKEFLQKRYPTNGIWTICPNVNIENVNIRVLEKKHIHIRSNKKNIKFGLIGSLDVDYKGHDTVIKALGLIKEKLPEFKVEFLGKGNSKRWCKLIEENDLVENIEFIGSLPSGQEVYNWIDQIDIMLQPSYAEAQGRSIIEAMSRACPIISTQVGGVGELIQEQWLVTPGNYIELSEKVLSMVLDKENQISEASRNYYESKQYYKKSIDAERKNFLELFVKNNNRMEVDK